MSSIGSEVRGEEIEALEAMKERLDKTEKIQVHNPDIEGEFISWNLLKEMVRLIRVVEIQQGALKAYASESYWETVQEQHIQYISHTGARAEKVLAEAQAILEGK